jgi:TolB-like protein/Tfp pilus assembly protein PilF
MSEDSANQANAGRDVFVSYASQDVAIADAIVAALEKNGIKCWIAPRDVTPGLQYADEIVGAINDAKVLVLVLSEHAVASPHVGREIERAASKRRRIVGLRTDAAPLTRSFEYFLSESQWIDVAALGMPGALTKLTEAVGQSLAPSSWVSPGLGADAENPADRKRKLKHLTIRRLVAAAVFLVAAAVVVGVVVRYWPSKQGNARAPAVAAISDKSIAVLPFTDMSEKKDQEYFADGMAEEIIDLLVKVPDLHVPARTSSFYFKDKSTKIPDIARELGVAHILEGSIRRSGNRLRVTTQLVRADTGYHVWSETYDRDLSDVFKVQDDIANAVVQALQISLMGGPLTRQKGGTQNLEAYQLFLRGVSAEMQNTRTSLAAANGYLDLAVKLDPDFARAWDWLALDTLIQVDVGMLPPVDGLKRTRWLAQHALQLSPELAEPHFVLGYVYRKLDWDWADAEAEVRQGLAADPTDPVGLMYAGLISKTLGRWDDAERQLRSARARDPLYTFAYFNLGETQYLAGHFAEAEASLRGLLELAPGFLWTHGLLARTLVAEGKPDTALAVAQQETFEEYRLCILPIVLQAVGRAAEADEVLKTVITKFADTEAYAIAMIYAYRNDHDPALQWLDRAYKQKDTSLVEIVGEPLFKNLANDPRFKAFLRKMNLPE